MLDNKKLKYYYGNLKIIPVEIRGKNCIDKQYANYRNYKLSDFNSENNVAILTGTEVFKNAFSLVLDCDINLHSDAGIKVFEAMLPEISDTVIVKSGGKHDGFHVHYLTSVPVSSALITFDNPKKGFIELKALKTFHSDNGEYLGAESEQMMLPPSINLKKYEVIHPQKADYIDFKIVRLLRIEELKQKIKNIKSIVNNLNI